jgi:hypothetical protein
LPGAAPGKGFAGCFWYFAGCYLLPAKRLNPVVYLVSKIIFCLILGLNNHESDLLNLIKNLCFYHIISQVTTFCSNVSRLKNYLCNSIFKSSQIFLPYPYQKLCFYYIISEVQIFFELHLYKIISTFMSLNIITLNNIFNH